MLCRSKLAWVNALGVYSIVHRTKPAKCRTQSSSEKGTTLGLQAQNLQIFPNLSQKAAKYLKLKAVASWLSNACYSVLAQQSCQIPRFHPPCPCAYSSVMTKQNRRFLPARSSRRPFSASVMRFCGSVIFWPFTAAPPPWIRRRASLRELQSPASI